MLENYIKLLRQGEISALENIYLETKNAVFAIIFSIVRDYQLSEDLMHETYIKIKQNISLYQNGTNAGAWINAIARNIAINEYNRRKREVLTAFDANTNLGSSYNLSLPDEFGIIKLVMERLKENEIKIVIMHTIGDIKLVDIAQLMEKPKGTIRWQYNNALKKIRQIIKEEGLSFET